MARSTVATSDFSSFANFTNVNTAAPDNLLSVSGGVLISSAALSGNEGAAYWSGTGTFLDDQFSEITIGGLSFLNDAYGVGVCVRVSTDTGTGRDYYFAYIASDSSGPNYTTILGKVVNGTRSVIHSASAAWSNGDKISLEVVGTTLTVFKNVTALGGSFTQTDSALSTGNPGPMLNGGAVITGDDWVGGNITASVNPMPAVKRIFILP